MSLFTPRTSKLSIPSTACCPLAAAACLLVAACGNVAESAAPLSTGGSGEDARAKGGSSAAAGSSVAGRSGGAGGGSGEAATPGAALPNVVIIFADDMGWGDVGYHGYTDIHTPNIDRLAAEGVWFSKGYVSASVCEPSRGGLLTGVYQQRFSAGENAGANPQHRTSQSLITELVKAQGYQTGMVGKWHLGATEAERPMKRGVDSFYGFLGGAHTFLEWRDLTDPAVTKGELDPNAPLFRNNDPLPAASNVYLTDLFNAEAVNYIELVDASKPFLLYVAYNAVHGPWQSTDQWQAATPPNLTSNQARQFFASMALAMDAGVGMILDALDARGFTNNTMVWFISDNGTPAGQGRSLVPGEQEAQNALVATGRGGIMSNAGPLRGYKGDTFEGGIRVPFALRWPGRITPNEYALPVSTLDVVPTIMARLGTDQPIKGHPFDGVDLMPYLEGTVGQERPHEVLYFRRDDDYAIRKGDWKLTWNDAHAPGTIQLFDLASDPNETTDLVANERDLAQQLQDTFDEWDHALPPSDKWGPPSNRNTEFANGNRRSVADFNASVP